MRFLLFLFPFLGLCLPVFAQTIHIPTTQGGFENTGGFTGNGWTVVNSTTNSWVIGSTAGPASGTNSAYISNNGVNFLYTPGASQTSHFYRDITVPAGQTLINLSFKFKCIGEAFFDRLLVYTAPTTVTPTINVPASSSSTLAGATLVYSDPGNITAYTNVNLILSPALAGTTFRLIFTWQNDATGSNNSPVSIDDIELVSSAGGPLNGTYTINSLLPTSPTIPAAGSNFNSFNAAINYLNSFGISGPVNFLVNPGSVHNEPLLSINVGGNATDTIVFKKNGAGVNPQIIPLRGSTTSDAAVLINGADYVTFEGIDINASIAPPNAQENIEFGYYLKNANSTNGTQNCRIKNAAITLSNNFTSNVGIYIHTSTAPSNSSGTNSFNTVDSVTILRSYVGIRELSNTTNRNDGTIIRNCTLGLSASNPIGNPTLTTTTAGIQVLNSSNITLRGNIVKYVSVSNAVDGIFVQNASGLNTVSHNQVSGVRNSSTSSTQIASGIRITLINGATANVFNNFVYDISHAYTTVTLTNKLVKGISIQPLTVVTNTTTYNVDFNSVQLDGSQSPNVSSSCLDVVQSGPIVNIRNNILSNITPNQAGNPAHYCITVPSTSIAAVGSISNRNNFYCPFPSNGFVGQTGANNHALLSNWIAATGLDINSLSVDPQFVSNTNLHVLSSDLDSAASFSGITWITDDIDGDARSTNVPDIGADEFSLVLFDIEMQALVQPSNNAGCFTNNQNVRVRIKNLAGQAHDFSSYPVFVQIDVSGAVNTQLLTQINDNSMVGGPLGSLQSLLYDAGTLNMTAYGDYIFRCKVFFPDDQNYANDSLSSPDTITNALPLSLPSSVSFNGFNGSNLNSVFPDWDEATGLVPNITNSSWNSVSGLGSTGNVTARVNLNTAGSYNWILSKKMQAASNSLLSFDAAICSPFALSAGTMGADDRLDVMISTDCGLSYNKIDSFDLSEGWNQNLQSVVVSLSQFNGQDIIVGLRAYSGAIEDGNCDLHIDNIMLFNSSSADLELKQILQPLASNCFPAASAVQINVDNVGFIDINFALTPLIVYMRTSGPLSQLVSDTINTGTLAQGASLNITLNDSLNFTLPGEYFVDAFIEISGGDVNIDNDTLSIILISQNPTASVNTARDTVCFDNDAVVFSSASANGLGINNLAPIAYTGLPVAIPDANANGIMIPLNVSGTAGFASQLVSVEVADLSHQFIAEVRIELVAPNGSKILLSELLGGSGNAYTNTIFTMSALNSISTASAPFTGNFLPLQNFNLLTGPANGTWHLKVTDLASGDLGSVTAWNLVFREPNSFVSYNWQSALSGNGASIDSIIYNVNQAAAINFTASDVYGCQVNNILNIYSTEDVQWNQPTITACGITNIPLNGGTPLGGYYSGNGVVNDTLFTLLAGSGAQQIKYFYESAGCLDSTTVTANVSLITLSAGPVLNVNCNGDNTGSATVNVTQASGPVTYLWNDANNQNTATANNLSAATYVVSVTDAICSSQFTFQITEPAVLIGQVNGSNISCFGFNDGQIDLSVSGGQTPYNFNWSNASTSEDLSNLSPGIYNVSITDANACSAINSVTITQPAALSGNIITIDLLCNGIATGSLDLNVNGGVLPYQYLWSNNSTAEDLINLNAGTYIVTVSDANACSLTETVTISEPSALLINLQQIDISCYNENDGAINLSATGGTAPYSYIWSNNATTDNISGLAPGNYNITLSDANGCTSINTASITEPSPYNISAVISDEIIGNDGAIDLSVQGANPPYSFIWNNAQTSEDLSGITGGNYSVTISDANNCDTVLTFNVPTVVSLNQIGTNNELLLYPNPAYNYIILTAQYPIQAQIITIFDAAGKEIERYNNPVLPLEMDINNLSPGLYIVRIQEHDKVLNLKFVKKL